MTRPELASFAVSAIPWFNRKADPGDPDSEDLWLVADPGFAELYPGVLRELRDAGAEATPLGIMPSQSPAGYARLIDSLGLRVAPGYATVALPEDRGLALRRGSREWSRWLESLHTRAAESHLFDLDTIFLSMEVEWGKSAVRSTRAAAAGVAYDPGRLERVTELLADAAELLRAEGIRAGLHNHVGTWVETEQEIDHVLSAIDPALLGASLDIGHLAWAGADPVAVVHRYRDRIVDLHLKDINLAVAARSREDPKPYNWAPSRGLFRELGEGDVDLLGVLDALPAGFPGWVVIEVDRTELEPIESARHSWRWVQGVARA